MLDVLEPLLRALKVSRERKGLSQRDLAAKAGLPHSHIAKIENADVNLKVSSLIEIARIRDLELFLFPREMIPAIQAMQRSIRGDRSSALERTIRQQIGRLLSRTERLITRRQPKNAVTHQLVAALLHLRASPITKDAANTVQHRLDEIRRTLDRIGRRGTEDDHRSDDQTLRDHVRDLDHLRLQIALSDTDKEDERRPAYQLRDDTV